MRIRRISKFRPRRADGPSASGWRRFQLRGGAVLLVLSVLAITVILVAAPTYWAFITLGQLNSAWNETHFAEINAVEEHWTSLPHLSPFRNGDEPHVKEFLAKQPLVLALLNRIETPTIWVRQGDRLVLAYENPDTQRFRRWFFQAEESQRFLWVPSKKDNPEAHLASSVVLRGDQWIVIKRWQPGSDNVDDALRLILGASPKFKLGLMAAPPSGKPVPKAEPWADTSPYQADAFQLDRSWFTQQLTSSAFEDWEIGAIPTWEQEQAMRQKVYRHFRLAAFGSGLVGISLFLGLWMRYRARKRGQLDADRLASLTHSLKTPLAILKVRCDSIRLGRLTPEQADIELMHIGDEVDHLTLIIENGLQAIRGVEGASPTDAFGPGWFRDLVEDIQPAFKTEGRRLDLLLSDERGRGGAASLRAAVLTLLENALYHGGGTVVLETFRQRSRFIIRISDEGEGIQPHQLEVLGKPFQRLRQEGKEGFRHEGQGLGISLLCQVAQREGWGLTFASAPGEGFTATIELRAA